NGYIVDENGIDYKVIQQIKEVKRGRIKEYLDYVPTATYVDETDKPKGVSSKIWTVPADIYLPCATQNEIDEAAAKAIVANGAIGVFEGANMPCTPEAIAVIKGAGVLYSPGKASNAGGVATSCIEMSQNSERLSWTFDEVDGKLKGIMEGIYRACADAAEKYGMKGDIQAGANIAGFLKVADAMLAQGVSY
ncbi:MAG: NADP-specific glutamate dehydrogenase, partial [Oscillospiraceae bacterium]|nr:NADP-specific glutamate dehydrogenase [Oscillospiraceae bacterium]